MAFKKMFLDHPASAGETYLQHGGRAIVLAFRMFGAGIAAVVHAIVPGLFTTTAGDVAIQIAEDVSEIRETSNEA